MARILKIEDICDTDWLLRVGIIGIDLDTKELVYLLCLDEKRQFNYACARRFDPSNLDGLPISSGNYTLKTFDKLFPRELIPYIEKLIDTHRAFNVAHGYPTTYMDDNLKSLRFRSTLYLKGAYAFYSPLENLVNTPTNLLELSNSSLENKEFINDGLKHELDHMKAARINLNGDGRSLNYTLGYWHIPKIPVDAISLGYEGILYQPKKVPVSSDQKTKALEEIATDYECYKGFPFYTGYYPHVGDEIDFLCDGRFIEGRYQGGIDLVNSYFLEIDSSQDMFNDLLAYLIDASFFNNLNAEGHARTLLKRYADLKKHKN